MYTGYYDESAVDGSGPISAIGGLVLGHDARDELLQEWTRAIGRAIHKDGFPQRFFHMKDFGVHNALAKFPIDLKRKLLSDLAWIIDDNKNASIESTLTPADYRENFGFLMKAESGEKYVEEEDERPSIHSTCFWQIATIQDKWADAEDYEYEIPFVLDDLCPDKDDISRSYSDMKKGIEIGRVPLKHLGTITWGDDKKDAALQAADLIAWAIRRRAAKQDFDKGTDPLLRIFDARHFGSHFENAWMKEATSSVRARLSRQTLTRK